jgi:molybdate transport system substrate-binding protein
LSPFFDRSAVTFTPLLSKQYDKRYGGLNISLGVNGVILMQPRVRCFLFALAPGLAAFASLTVSVSAQDRPVIVFAAASLAGALDSVVDAFENEFGIGVTVSYAGTPALARQIEQGAPADVFISADSEWMNYIVRQGLVDEANRVDLLGNQLVLIAPAPMGPVRSPEIDTTILEGIGPGRLLSMANTESVPAGRYGKATLAALGIWNEVAPYVVQTDSVRTALVFVARAEATFGIVYATDGRANPNVSVLATFDGALHPPIIYPAAIVKGSDSPAVEAFFSFLQSNESVAIFVDFGFMSLIRPDG